MPEYLVRSAKDGLELEKLLNSHAKQQYAPMHIIPPSDSTGPWWVILRLEKKP